MSAMRTYFLVLIGLMLAALPGCQRKDPVPERWTRTFGGADDDWGFAVVQSRDGGYVVVGTTFSFGVGTGDIYLLKADAKGNLEWSRTLGDESDEMGQSVQATKDGGYIIAASGENGARLIKTDDEGNQVWAKTLDGRCLPEGQVVLQARDGGYVVLCWSGDGSDLIKTDATGRMVWTEPLDLIGESVLQVSDGGYIVIGEVDEPGGLEVYDLSLVKVDASGSQVWSNSYSNPEVDDYGYAVAQASDGGYVIAGKTDSGIHLVRTDALGNEVWTKDVGGPGAVDCRWIERTRDGDYIITGSIRPPGTMSGEVYLLRVGPNGDSLWARSYGGEDDSWATSVKQTSDNGFVIAGSTCHNGSVAQDVYLIKTDAEGNAEPDTL